MSENSAARQEQPTMSKWLILSIRVGNLILALLSSSILMTNLNPYDVNPFKMTFYSVLTSWIVCAIFLFFRSKIAWFGSLLGLVAMAYGFIMVLLGVMLYEDMFLPFF